MQTLVDIVKDLDVPFEKKRIYTHLAKKFEEGRPVTLYLSQYELANGTDPLSEDVEHFEGVRGSTPQLWEEFLQIPEVVRYIQVKTADLLEIDARKALQSMVKRGLSNNAQAVQAAKQILEHSKMLQQSMKRKDTVILTYVSPKEYPPPKKAGV